MTGPTVESVMSPQDRASGVWDYISPSRLNLWLKCPLAFRLRYIDGIVTASSASLFIGKLVHAGLERFYRCRQLGVSLDLADLIAGIEAQWGPAKDEESVSFASADDEIAARQQTADLLRAYLAFVPKDEARPLAVEASIEAPLLDPRTGENLGIPLLGVMDLVLDEPAGPAICDFKTAARGADPLEISHEVQLSSYAYLYRAASGKTESGLEIRSLVKTKTPQIQRHRYGTRGEHHFARLFALIRAYLDDLDRGQFVYRPGFGCTMCEHRNTHCRTWAG